jgi:hypothetical protein
MNAQAISQKLWAVYRKAPKNNAEPDEIADFGADSPIPSFSEREINTVARNSVSLKVSPDAVKAYINLAAYGQVCEATLESLEFIPKMIKGVRVRGGAEDSTAVPFSITSSLRKLALDGDDPAATDAFLIGMKKLAEGHVGDGRPQYRHYEEIRNCSSPW